MARRSLLLDTGCRVSLFPDTPAHGSHERTTERRMRRPTASPSQIQESVIIEGSDRVEFRDVEALSYRRLSLVCRVGSTLVSVPPRRILPGSQVRRRGDRGKLVLPKEVAVDLGLA